jgi:hypothetical protein
MDEPPADIVPHISASSEKHLQAFGKPEFRFAGEGARATLSEQNS